MKAKVSQRLVVDASLLSAAGREDTISRTSAHCRQVLRTILRVCHRVVTTEEIVFEWDNHQSPIAREWRVAMLTHNKFVPLAIGFDREDLFEKIELTHQDRDGLPAMKKDFRLIVAALATDSRVISLDTKARSHYSRASDEVDELRGVMWVHPDDEDIVFWLEESAEFESHRCIGYRQGEPL